MFHAMSGEGLVTDTTCGQIIMIRVSHYIVQAQMLFVNDEM